MARARSNVAIRTCIALLGGLLAAGRIAAQSDTTVPQPRTWAEAEQSETESDAHPENVAIRVQLIRYYFHLAGEAADRVKPLRRKHLVWMIEHHSEHHVLAESAATIDKSGNALADPEAFAEADAAWRKHFTDARPLADTFANGATFYKMAEPAFARQLVEDGLKLYPGNARLMIVKGALLAYSIAGVKALDQFGRASAFEKSLESTDAAHDRKELELTTDTNLLGAAAQTLQQQVYALRSRNLAAKAEKIEDLVAHLYQQAIELDPNSSRWKSGLISAYQSMASQRRTPAEKIPFLEKALSAASNSVERGYVLTDLSQAYFNAGKLSKATEAATELVNTTGDSKSNWNYGNAIHIGNIVLGRIALKRGDAQEAATRLLAAGRTPGSPQLNSVGPNWSLAQDLLAQGDRASVLSFLDLCGSFWTSGRSRLDSFTATIRSGGTPNFFGPAEPPRRQLIGRAAPDFRLMDLNGGEVALSQFKGKVVLLDFWATWCGPCRQEIPDLEKIHRKLGAKDVAVLALDVNEPQDTVAAYIHKEKYTLPVLLTEGTDVVGRYSVNAYPTTFAIDKDGRIADILLGSSSDNAARLHAVIEKARAGAPAPASGVPLASSATPSAATAEDSYRDGIRLRNGKDLVGAIKAFDRALELRPDWLAAITLRANLYYQLKQYENAIADLTRAIQIEPKRAASYEQRGLAYSNAGKHAQAVSDYTRAIELDPNLSGVWNNRGWAHLELGQLDLALSDLSKSIELNPAYTTALFNRAHLYTRRKEYAEAIADFDAILRVMPADSAAASQKAEAQRLMNAELPSETNPAAPTAAMSSDTPSTAKSAAQLKLPATYVSAQTPADQLQLNADNTFSLQEAGQTYSGTFAADGSTLKLNISGGQETTATIQGNNLTDGSGQTWVLREQPAQAASGAGVLQNQDIIKMVKAGLEDAIIMAKIAGSNCQFDTSTDALIQLKQNGVSSAVLKAVVGAGK